MTKTEAWDFVLGFWTLAVALFFLFIFSIWREGTPGEYGYFVSGTICMIMGRYIHLSNREKK